MKSTKFWVTVVTLLLVISCAGAWAVYHFHGTGNVAYIYQNGELLERINLDAVTSPYEFKIESKSGGYNTVLVEPGRVCISDASCPDHVCMNTGWISDGIIPIVCLPNELVIQINNGNNDHIDVSAQ